MSGTMRPPIAPLGWSIALHAVLAALLIFGLTLPRRAEEPVILPIDAVVVDDAVLQAAGRKRQDDERADIEARKRAEAEAEEKRQEQERLEQEQEQQRAEETGQAGGGAEGESRRGRQVEGGSRRET